MSKAKKGLVDTPKKTIKVSELVIHALQLDEETSFEGGLSKVTQFFCERVWLVKP